MYIMVSDSSKHKKGIQASPRDVEECGWIEMCIFPQKMGLQLWHWSGANGVTPVTDAHPCCSADTLFMLAVCLDCRLLL